MTKFIARVGAVLFFGLLGNAALGSVRQSVSGGSRDMGVASTAGGDHIEEGTVRAQGGASARPRPAPREMSDDEKERRREVCNSEFETCYDWCGRSTKPRSVARGECNQRCTKELVACMKKVPN